MPGMENEDELQEHDHYKNKSGEAFLIQAVGLALVMEALVSG
jgi:hypothetical protein